MKKAAIHSILSQKVAAGDVVFVEDFTVESGKTKDMVGLLRGITDSSKVVLVTATDDVMLKRAARNIPWLQFLNWNRLRAHDLFYAKKIVVMESAAKQLSGVETGGQE